ncbi:hypothetical protein [Paraburkholderia sp. JHI869]|uniref:hypothetical protein n=1 Tax=Paraburkholderia sp. JHI869 TaxID=3112959 RepID=UPI00317AE188
MSNNVHALPVQRKRGRRRVYPVPGVPVATVLDFASDSIEAETAEQRLARTEKAVHEVAYHLLMAARAIKRIEPLA